LSADSQANNPYAAPSAGAEAGRGSGFVLSDELRKLIVTTSTLMIIAAVLQVIPGLARIITEGASAWSLGSAAVFGVVPGFVAFAGVSLRGVAKRGDDLTALLNGLRQLAIAFLIKGVVLIAIIGMFLLGLLLVVFGVGAGFTALFG